MGTVAAGDTFGLVDFSQSIFVIGDCLRVTDAEAGTAALAVLLIYAYSLFGDIRTVVGRHTSVHIGKYVVDVVFAAEAEHYGADRRLCENIVECGLVA